MNYKDNRAFTKVRPALSSEPCFNKLIDHIARDRESDLTGAALPGGRLRRICLHGRDLSFSDLTGADLRQSDLSDADLTTAEMSFADLRGTNLRRANLFGADLFGANLSGANLAGAWLGGADLDATNLSATILRSASYDRDTRWPEGFDPRAHGAVLVACVRSRG